MDEVKWYKTKLTIEVDVMTQFGPNNAISLVNNLLQVPAITSVDLIKLKTDYVPLTELDVNRKVMSNVPCKLR